MALGPRGKMVSPFRLCSPNVTIPPFRLVMRINLKNAWLTALMPLLVSQSLSTGQDNTSAENRYGVIEIGSSGIKAIVIEKLKDDPKTPSEDPPTNTVKEYDVLNPGAYKGSAEGVAKEVGTEVGTFAQRMQDEEKVPSDHIYVVGSSGLPEDVRRTIGNNVEDRSIEFINVERETSLTFKGIVPPRRLHLNEVVLLDIGSGNSKGTYLKQSKPTLQFVSFSIPFGSKLLAQTIDQKPDDAAKLLQDSVVAPVQAETKEFEGMKKCTRLYLAGGIPWTMAVLLHPDKFGPDEKGHESNWVPITPADIQKYCQVATSNPASLFDADLSAVRTSNLTKVKKDIDQMRSIFSLNKKKVEEAKLDKDQYDLKAIKAGAAILQTFAEAMDYEKKRAIFFSKRALYAWPHGYILEKLSAERPAATAESRPEAPAPN
jgi:hypothetical protein